MCANTNTAYIQKGCGYKSSIGLELDIHSLNNYHAFHVSPAGALTSPVETCPLTQPPYPAAS